MKTEKQNEQSVGIKMRIIWFDVLCVSKVWFLTSFAVSRVRSAGDAADFAHSILFFFVDFFCFAFGQTLISSLVYSNFLVGWEERAVGLSAISRIT